MRRGASMRRLFGQFYPRQVERNESVRCVRRVYAMPHGEVRVCSRRRGEASRRSGLVRAATNSAYNRRGDRSCTSHVCICDSKYKTRRRPVSSRGKPTSVVPKNNTRPGDV